MPAHILPKILKIGEYELNKETFTLKHKNQRKDSSGRKRYIEYACDDCGDIIVFQMIQRMGLPYPWLCRGCNLTMWWKNDNYRNGHLASFTDERREELRVQFQRISLQMWKNPIKREQIITGLRNRSPECYSKSRKTMRKSVVLLHWKTGQELVCVGSYEVAFVNWCETNHVDFDWQIPFKMDDNRLYIIDAFVKDGEFANIWVEIKGWMTAIGKEKWTWFHTSHESDSQLWDKCRLEELGILCKTTKKMIVK